MPKMRPLADSACEHSPEPMRNAAARSDGTDPLPVERLFPFVLRSRILIVGRDTLARSKSRLQFIMIT